MARITEDVVPVMWLDHPLPLAYSVDGRPGIIVATDGLARSLTEPQRRAVLAHEHAHLRGHHHLMIRICAVMAAALPWIPLFAAAPRAVATLVELDADEIAATATSRPAMCGALRAVSESASTEHSGLASFGNEVVALRLRRLESASGSTPQRFSAVVALCLPATLAAGIAAASIAGMGGIACLLLP
ncbi:M56 family metallopeptidase [Nocardia ninae]|uniref:M56 family metallopeptidase n=1 Tax=Nocardia ninae TaxID=356145 RepID=UPI001649A2F6|nr:M56 family metallopeptidase [Nocardia ninae]